MQILIAQLVTIGIIKGKKIAIDSSHIPVYSNPKNHSDPDAKWGCKGEDYFFFGYKIHLVVDTKSQLPIDVIVIVTPGNSADSPYANLLIKKTKGLVSPKLATMDAASDSHENYQICKDYGIIPIIDLNNRWKKPKSKDINLFTELSIPKVGSSLITIGDRFICPATYGPLRKDGRESKRKNRQFIHFKHNGSNYQTNQGLHFQK